MSFRELQLEEIQHEHPLILTDLQLLFQNYDDYYDDDIDDNDLIMMQNFTCICDRCDLRIDWYHRYYYKCSNESCNYSLHKFCAEISTTLRSPAHPTHILILKKGTTNWRCCDCLIDHQDGICYHCSRCSYQIDMRCATFREQKMVHHPGHPHPLISVTTEPLEIMTCFACGDYHNGEFYHCTTCFNFSINSQCLSLPIKLFREYHRSHMLTLSYSFLDHQSYGFECRSCKREINNEYWLYKCSKCMFYVHIRCANTQWIQPEPGSDEIIQMDNVFTANTFLPLPLPDESYNNLTHQIPKWDPETCQVFDQITTENCHLKHFSHKHPLVLIALTNKSNNDAATSTSGVELTSLHNPMKRVKLLCNGCARPVTSMPFYKCSHEHECSNFVLHEWCARLRTKVEDHPTHRKHTLVLGSSSSVFCCSICRLPCNGFAYKCTSCRYCIDVNCKLMPLAIAHEVQPTIHLIKCIALNEDMTCRACQNNIDKGDTFYCNNFYGPGFCLHSLCALRLPKTIRHKYDEHFLKLSYSPIENHKDEYFCEVCEEQLNPKKWFYHCSVCARSIHSACVPLILQSEQGASPSNEELVYRFINMKFGGVYNIEDHEHSVSFVAGVDSDRDCTICGLKLQSKLIYKCLQCKFAIHNYCESSIADDVKQELVKMLDDLDKKWKPKVKPHHQRVLSFYPKRLTRPMTTR